MEQPSHGSLEEEDKKEGRLERGVGGLLTAEKMPHSFGISSHPGPDSRSQSPAHGLGEEARV